MARRLKAEGWSLKRIADAMDTKKSTVASWLSGRRRNQTPSEWKYGRK
ncbi:helix-turn-helix domain-containing protein [Hydrogenophaga sp.]